MKLADLKPEFVRFGALRHPHMYERQPVPTLAEAQGIRFGCPNPDPNYEGLVICIPFRGRGAPSDENGGHQWDVSGTGMHDLTLSPSVNCVDIWHGWVRSGEVTNA